ncbi:MULTISPECIES: hypothetical protein [Lysobacteraceae]|uniref:hypothetical protein n=1 Tax=Lysobacteraceae TaxID=32033 RepID=UPI001BCE22BF|nr:MULTISPECIES: hypothetical protein [Lysobacter]
MHEVAGVRVTHAHPNHFFRGNQKLRPLRGKKIEGFLAAAPAFLQGLLLVAKELIGLRVRYHARQRTWEKVGPLIEKARMVMPQPVVG